MPTSSADGGKKHGDKKLFFLLNKYKNNNTKDYYYQNQVVCPVFIFSLHILYISPQLKAAGEKWVGRWW
jgi:hypothetical protein